MLDKKRIEKFKKVFEEYFGEELSDEEAKKAMNRLLKIARVVSRHSPKQNDE